MNKKKDKMLAFLGILPFIIIVVGFLVEPILVMVVKSFEKSSGMAFSLMQYKDIFTSSFYLDAFKNSILLSLGASILGIIIATVTTYFITKLSKKTQDLVLNLSNLTSNFAGVPLAFAFIIMLGNSGIFVIMAKIFGIQSLLNFSIYSWTGLVIIYTYFEIPLAIMLLYPTLLGVKEELKNAAALLGASNFTFWKNIGLPMILPGMVGVFSILFANAMGAYATAYSLVGGNLNLLTIQIGGLVQGNAISGPNLACALAVLLALILTAVILIGDFTTKRIRRDI